MSEQEQANQAARKTVDAIRIALGLSGLVAIVLGILILLNPDDAAAAVMKIVVSVFAVLAILVGIIYIAVALFSRTVPGGKRVLRALVGVIYIVVGVVLFMFLSETATVLLALFSILVGISWIVEGVIALLTLGDSGSKVLMVVYALLSIVAGVALVVTPLLGATVVAWLLGLALLVIGIVQVVRAFAAKSEIVAVTM